MSTLLSLTNIILCKKKNGMALTVEHATFSGFLLAADC
jgi:hypothetical protein